MKKEDLVKMGLTEEQADQVLKAHNDTLANEFVPMSRFTEVTDQVKARDKQIAELNGFKGTSEELQSKITELEAANKKASDEYNSNIANERKANSIKLSLLQDPEGVPQDINLVLGLLDSSKITLDDKGSITGGLSDQLTAIRKDKAFLFKPVQTPPNPNPNPFKPTGINPAGGSAGDPAGDATINFGKNLASAKLGQMGIAPKANETK